MMINGYLEFSPGFREIVVRDMKNSLLVLSREWMGMRVAGMIMNSYGLDHSLIPDLKHQ